MRLVRRLLAVFVAAGAAVSCTGRSSPESPREQPAAPSAMAALGDSITRAFAACDRAGDCVEASWATGTVEQLHSHAQRLELDDPDSNHNLAVSGAQVAGLASQAEAAVLMRPATSRCSSGPTTPALPTRRR